MKKFSVSDSSTRLMKSFFIIRNQTNLYTNLLCYTRRFFSTASLDILPKFSLMDEEVTISAKNLIPQSVVKLETRLTKSDERFNFVSSNFYKVCEDGSFSSVSSAPLPPSSYQGCHRSGPLWSVQSLPGHKPRLWPQNIGTHLTYELTLRDAASDEVLTRASAVKTFLASGVKRVVVREGRIRGVLFLPPEPGPAVITIYGGASNNRIPEDRAALLASKGYVTLALAFFGVDDLPPIYTTDGIDLDYFEEAVDYVLALPEVQPKRLGLFGLSMGGNISLLMSSNFCHKIQACAVVSSPGLSAPGPTTYRGKVVTEATNFDENHILRFHGGVDEAKRHPGRHIPVHKTVAPILAVVGEEDESVFEIFSFLVSRWREQGKTDITFHSFPGAGHLIDPPFSPHCRWGGHPYLAPGVKVDYGGRLQQHALAQFSAWKMLLEFYNEYLLK